MKLVVGLGNPGKKYAHNRHNIGFMTLEAFATQNNLAFKESNKFKAFECKYYLPHTTYRILLIKPFTYMNTSGEIISSMLNFYKINSADVLLIYDELALPFGTLRSRFGGSDAGHNGVKSVINLIGKEFWRLRVGIANEHSQKTDASKFVLANFSKNERESLPAIFKITNKIINEFINTGNLEETTQKLTQNK